MSFCDVSLLLAVGVEGPAASSGRGAYSGVCQCKFVGIGTGRSHGDLDAAHRDAHLCPDLQQFQSDRAAGGLGEPGVGEAEAAQGADQDIGKRRKPKPQLVGVILWPSGASCPGPGFDGTRYRAAVLKKGHLGNGVPFLLPALALAVPNQCKICDNPQNSAVVARYLSPQTRRSTTSKA